MEELELGPNGGLLYCMEYLVSDRTTPLSARNRVQSRLLRRRSTQTSGCKTCLMALVKMTMLYSTAQGRCVSGAEKNAGVHYGSKGLVAALQIELYSHSPVLRSLAERMKVGGWR